MVLNNENIVFNYRADNIFIYLTIASGKLFFF